MIIDANTLSETKEYQFQYCILGGGVAGLTLANELLASGKSVCIVEGGDETFTMESQTLYTPSQKPKMYEDTTYNRLRFLGGSSNHWENSTSEFKPSDFKAKSWIKHSGWPINFEDVKPFYKRAAQYCGTGADGYETKYWVENLEQTDVFRDSTAVDSNIVKAAIPPVHFFAKYGAPLVEASNVSIFKNANLIDLEFNRDSSEVESIVFTNYSGVKQNVTADTFVLCLGGIENARLMLVFNEKYENLLGNSSDCVGRYFMDHPVLRAAKLYPEDKEKLSLYTMRKEVGDRLLNGFIEINEDALMSKELSNIRVPLAPASHYVISEGIESFHVLGTAWDDKELPDNFGQHVVNVLSDIDMVTEAISRKAFGDKLFDYSEDFGGYDLPIMIEQTPKHDNRIYLSDEVDELGMKKILVDWTLHDDDIARMWGSLEVLGKELGRLKLGRLKIMREYEERLRTDKLFFSHHHMGTTRMAENEKNGVVDRNLKVFNTQNFYIAGSSVFPTGSHVPPTLTIAALTIRLAEHLLKEASV
ncbi:6'''-hydroxyparomomycin C oxidase [Paraglaciecola mesophila]|uniref:6'''-hydroxyparomomycin C oxidase n=1 Tax=Paraglaciecola mesophila TaxID=197222 RepID=A0A857JJ14_9ALTE|nr:6'''-hydroxyparomomycin C oxidase [Paraglaciecola mesophila]